MARMRPGDGPRALVESTLLPIAQADESQYLSMAVLLAACLGEKMGRMVRAFNWSLVMAIELRRSKDERGVAKERA